MGPGATPHVMEEDANLSYEKLNSAKSYQVCTYYAYLPQEDHATVSHQAIFNAFRGSTRLIHKRIRAVYGPRTLVLRPENYSIKRGKQHLLP